MPTLPVIVVLVQVAAAVIFGLGIRAVGTGRRQPARHGLWIGPVLFLLAAPAAGAHIPRWVWVGLLTMTTISGVLIYTEI